MKTSTVIPPNDFKVPTAIFNVVYESLKLNNQQGYIKFCFLDSSESTSNISPVFWVKENEILKSDEISDITSVMTGMSAGYQINNKTIEVRRITFTKEDNLPNGTEVWDIQDSRGGSIHTATLKDRNASFIPLTGMYII